MIKKPNKEQVYLAGVLLFAFVLRAFNFFELSFFKDELSALTRTQFSSFSDLFKYGILVDGHPPLLQVFLYFWTGVFGYSELAVKLPFLLISILSLYFLYRVAKAFTESMSVSLVVTLFFACNQLHLTYSTQCRMYITGFLFVLCLVFYWHLWLTTHVKKYLYLMLFFAVLGAYNHHFNVLVAIIVWFSGLIWVSKTQMREYIYALILTAVFSAPAFYVAYCQLAYADPITWMGPIQIDFIPNFFRYFFYYNPLLYIVSIAGILLYFFRKKEKSTWVTISFCWFFLVFFIGYMYSAYVSPMLQFHLLIFVSPFLVIPIFSGFSSVLDDKKQLVLDLFVALTSLFSLVYSRQHFTLFPKQHYQALAKTVLSLNLEKEKVLVVSDVNFKYLAFYLKENMAKIDTLSIGNINAVDYTKILSEYTYIVCATENLRLKPYFTPSFVPAKKVYQGQLIEIEVLRKQTDIEKKEYGTIDREDSLCYTRNLQLKEQMLWSMSYETSQIDQDGDCFVTLLKEKSYWFPSIKFLHDGKSSYCLEFEFKAKELHPNTKIMASAKQGAASIFYTDAPLNKFFKSNGETWTKASICINKSAVAEYLEKPVELEMMLFKEIGHELSIKNVQVKAYKENPYLYSILDPIKE